MGGYLWDAWVIYIIYDIEHETIDKLSSATTCQGLNDAVKCFITDN